MALTRICGGPRDGEVVACACDGECRCVSFGHGAPNGNKILDGYVELLMYKRKDGCWVPSHVHRETMVANTICPSCDRPMPAKTVYCINCGAEIDVSQEWEGSPAT